MNSAAYLTFNYDRDAFFADQDDFSLTARHHEHTVSSSGINTNW